jgi:hypothetical protein
LKRYTVRGYLRIEDAPLDQTPQDAATVSMWEPKDWRLVRLNKTGGLLDYEQILLDGLFQDATTGSGGPSTRLSELGPGFAGRLRLAQDALYTDVAGRGWFTGRPDRVRRKVAAHRLRAVRHRNGGGCRGSRFQPPRADTGPGGAGRIGADRLCPLDAGAHGEGNRPGPPACRVPQLPHHHGGRADPARRPS